MKKPSEEFHFAVVDSVERLPGTYVEKNGEFVPWDGSDVSHVMIFERLTVREMKKRFPLIQIDGNTISLVDKTKAVKKRSKTAKNGKNQSYNLDQEQEKQ